MEDCIRKAFYALGCLTPKPHDRSEKEREEDQKHLDAIESALNFLISQRYVKDDEILRLKGLLPNKEKSNG